MSTAKRTNIQDARRLIFDREQFTAGGAAYNGTANFRGVKGDTHWGTGKLNLDDTNKFYQDRTQMTYIVYSYGTPIAWHTIDNGWYVVNQKFSISTTRHQTAVRSALAMFN